MVAILHCRVELFMQIFVDDIMRIISVELEDIVRIICNFCNGCFGEQLFESILSLNQLFR